VETVAGKPKLNRAMYIETLRRMSPEERLSKAFELSEMTRELLKAGLAQRYPSASAEELHRLYLERLERCRCRIY
jgi:hypothetical protein